MDSRDFQASRAVRLLAFLAVTVLSAWLWPHDTASAGAAGTPVATAQPSPLR